MQWNNGDNTFQAETQSVQTSLKSIQINTTFPASLTVMYIRVRVLGKRNSPWSLVSNKWTTARECDFANQYLDTSGEYDQWHCRSCPAGATCAGADVTWDKVRPLFGWWRNQIWTEQAHSLFTQCNFPPACLGAKNAAFGGMFVAADGITDPSARDYNESCNAVDGYATECDRDLHSRCRLCATCGNGYFRQEVGGTTQCWKCPTKQWNIAFLTFGSILGLALLCVMVYFHMDGGGRQTIENLYKVVILNYFQLTHMIANMDINWPEPMRIIFNVQGAISTIGEHLLNPACELTHMRAADLIFQKQIGYVFVLPALIIASKMFWRALSWKQGRPYRYRGENRRSPSLKDGSVATIVFLMYFMYPTLCNQAFVLVVCKEVGGTLYMASDLQEVCWEGRHLLYFFVCTVPQIILHVIGIPLLGLRAAYYGRKNRLKFHFSISLFRYGMLYSAYSEKRWYWGAVIASRKAAVAFITSILNNAGLEVHWILLFLSISVALNIFFDPYIGMKGIKKEDVISLQRFDSASMLVLLWTSWTGLFFNIAASCGPSQVYCFTVLLCVVSMNVVFFFYCMLLFRAQVSEGWKSFVSFLTCGKKNKISNKEHRRSILQNPLKFRRSFTKRREFFNPMLSEKGQEWRLNRLRARSRDMARQSTIVRVKTQVERVRHIQNLTGQKSLKYSFSTRKIKIPRNEAKAANVARGSRRVPSPIAGVYTDDVDASNSHAAGQAHEKKAAKLSKKATFMPQGWTKFFTTEGEGYYVGPNRTSQWEKPPGNL